MTYAALNADQRGGGGVHAGKPSFTIEQAAEQLTREGLSWSRQGQGTTVTYAYRSTAPDHIPGDAAGFQRFGAGQISATEQALAQWAKVADITFQRVDDGNGYSNNATILFADYSSGESGADAFAVMPGSRSAASAAGDVWINSTFYYNSEPFVGNYGLLTLLHEIGHAIGLSHPSDYDVGDDGGESLNYAANAGHFEDSLEYTVMSYFDDSETGGAVHASSPSTPLIDDIAAAQRLYGANRTAATGNDTYQATGWQAIWDAGGADTITARNSFGGVSIDLHPGAFSNVDGGTGNLAIALGTTIENAIGSRYGDTLIGSDAGSFLEGDGGDDLLFGGRGANVFIGGDENDRAFLNGNAGDYSLLVGAGGYVLQARNGSGSQFIDRSVETVQFQNGQYLSLKDVPAYVASGMPAGAAVQVASALSGSYLVGTGASDWAVVAGNASDYMLGRNQSSAGQARAGDMVLTSKAGFGTVTLAENIDVVQFQNGQYLSLKDLPAYLGGNPALDLGGTQDDLLFQSRGRGYEFFSGGAGDDTLYLKGNRADYLAAKLSADAAGNGSAGSNGLHYAGTSLIATNGSGVLMVDGSVETVVFRNGDRVAGSDLLGMLKGAGDPAYSGELHFVPLGATYSSVAATGTADRLLLNADAADYTLSRGYDGSFVLRPNGFYTEMPYVSIDQSVAAVQFLSGQYLAPRDLAAYVKGSDVFTRGTAGNDILVAAPDGDQTIYGGAGTDDAYLHGNVGDYTIARYSIYHPADPYAGASINYGATAYTESGFKLLARNGSGNISIDDATEVIHFQNGQYLAYADLAAWIAHDAGF